MSIQSLLAYYSAWKLTAFPTTKFLPLRFCLVLFCFALDLRGNFSELSGKIGDLVVHRKVVDRVVEETLCADLAVSAEATLLSVQHLSFGKFPSHRSLVVCHSHRDFPEGWASEPDQTNLPHLSDTIMCLQVDI